MNTILFWQCASQNMEVISQMEEQSQIVNAVRPPWRLSARVLIIVFIVIILISAWLVYTYINAISTAGTSNVPLSVAGKPVGSVNFSKMVNIQSSAGGLDATFQITPGPYFLSQMLQVNMTLTNHSQKTLQIAGGSCGYGPLEIDQSGGGAPSYQLPLLQIPVFCPGPLPTSFAPGQTITSQDDIVLTSSGAVTLTENASFYTTATQIVNGQKQTYMTNGKSPLDGHWPSLHINVASQVPSDRVLALQAGIGTVTIAGPENVLGHLLYQETYSCYYGNTGGAQFPWTPVIHAVVHAPECLSRWTYVVGSPGYAVASGRAG